MRSYLNYGITSFENLGSSLLTVFLMITSETWNQQLTNLADVDFPIIGAFYCVLIIVVGQFFILNLILAVIIKAFMKSQHELLAKEIRMLEGGGEDEENADGNLTEKRGTKDESPQEKKNISPKFA